MTALVGIVVVLAALYLLWRFRYGTPPPHWPQALCFHKISSRFCWEGTWTTPGRFFAAVDRLRDRGYRFVGVDEYLSAIGVPVRPQGGDDPSDTDVCAGNRDNRSNPVQNRTLLLTFDDGYHELYDVVLPGLESRNVPFHVFLVTDFVGLSNEWDLSLGRRPFRHLGWSEIEEMAARGVTFGSHGASHGDFTFMPPERVRDELRRSKSAIEEHIGSRVGTFSYPFGRYDAAAKDAVRAAGYDAAFSMYPAHPNTQLDRYAIRRNGVYIIDPARLVETKITPGPLFWFEEMKCRAINGVARITPWVKKASPGRRATN